MVYFFLRTAHHKRKSGQELKHGRDPEAEADAEAMEGCCFTDLLPTAFSVFFLIQSRTTRPNMATPTMGWALLHQSLIKKMAYSWILWRHFLN